MTRNKIAVAVMVLIIVSPIAFSAVSSVLTRGPEPFLDRPDERYDACVRETEYMRFHHMDYLKEIREEYVRYGIREAKGLSSCQECHTERAAFCDRCHETVDLNIDCFGCHSYPSMASVIPD